MNEVNDFTAISVVFHLKVIVMGSDTYPISGG